MKAVINIKGFIGNIPLLPSETEDNKQERFTYSKLVSLIRDARKDGVTEFEFVIDSMGGLVSEGFLIADYIQSLEEPTTSFAIQVFSIANVIYFASDKRVGEPMSLFMMHPTLTEVEGNADMLRDVADILDKETDRIAGYIASRTDLDFQAVKGLMGVERYIESNEAKDLGFYNQAVKLKIAAVSNQESYTDYPESASNNAKKALKWLEENGNPNDCLTRVGFARANQLTNKEALSLDTVKRMAQFNRHNQYKDVPYEDGCGGVAWDAWGGTSGIEWAQSIVDKSTTNKSEMENKAEEKVTKSTWQTIGQKLGLLNMEQEEMEESEVENMEDKDKEIEALKATIAELKSQLQAMQEGKQEMEEKKKEEISDMEKKYNALFDQVSNVQKELEEAKRRTSNATPPSAHQRFNQTKKKPEPAKADGKPSKGLTGAAKFRAQWNTERVQNRK